MKKTQTTFTILLLTWIMIVVSFASEPELSFRLECPGNVTVSCMDELWDLSIYGHAYIWEHYVKRDAGPPTRVERDLNSCGVGEIRRIWEVEDPNWNIVTCTQTITVGARGGFGEKDIIWPESFDTSGCTLDLDPYKLPKKYSIPRFKRVACSKPGYSYKDRVFTVNGSCKKIMRTWEVVDCCNWNPDDPWGKGYWKHYQIIKLIQKDSPTITNCPKKIEVEAKTCDGAFVDLDTVVAIDKCGNKLKVWHNSPYADTSRGPDATGTYPIGTTKFYYIIKYSCGRTIKCPVEITVKNNLQPRVYCRSGVITTLMGMDTDGDGVNDEGMAEIWAKDLDRGSTPKCGGKRLWFSFSSDTSDMSRIFTCDNVGENEVHVWVTDEFGNQTYCVTKVIIQNNASNIKDCMPDSLRPKINHLAGIIATSKGEPIEEAHVTLTDSEKRLVVHTTWDTSIVETRDTFIGKSGNQYVRIHKDTTITATQDRSYEAVVYRVSSNSAGTYAYDSIPKGRSYRLAVSMGGQAGDGVNTHDLFRLMNHLNGFAPFQSAYSYIAADLDENGIVDQKDYSILLSSLMPFGRKTDPFRAWKFIDKHKEIDLSKTLDYNHLENCVFGPLDADHTDMDFVAIKLGDIDRAGSGQPWLRQESLTVMRWGDAVITKDDKVLIPVFLDKKGQTSGMVNLEWPEHWRGYTTLVDGTAMVSSQSDDATGYRTIVWVDPFVHPSGVPLFYIRLNTSEEALQSLRSVRIVDGQDAYCMDKDGVSTRLDLRFADEKISGLSSDRPTVGPNPFVHSFHVRFSHEMVDHSCKVEVYDVVGKIVMTWAGMARVEGKVFHLPSGTKGNVFICKIQSGARTYSTKLVRLK